MDPSWLNQMVDDLQRQYGVLPPVQPAYQIHPHHFISSSNPSQVHYSSTFDKGSPPHYPSTPYTSIHSPPHYPSPWKWNN